VAVDEQVAEFVSGRYAALLRRAYLLTGDQRAAEDLVQETLLRCCSAWRRSAAENPDAYAARTMANLCVSGWRRRRFREQPLPETTEPTPYADGAAERAERDAMWQTLQAAPAGQRAVLVLRYYEDLPEADVAQILGISVGAVRSQAAKGLATLRRVRAAAEETA
jgi:RNA polymerase sigma-70 factor (sigma-E family)